MKKTLILFVITIICASVSGQAKKPTIMVVPSDAFCISKGYFTTVNLKGSE